MKSRVFSKGLAVAVIILFVGVGIHPAFADIVKEPHIPISSGNTLYVGGTGPGNYTKIQDAINNASDNGTVFVYTGIYYENIFINKTINLIGENKQNTILDCKSYRNVVDISSDYVNISGFTIQNSSTSGGLGIKAYAKYLTIHDNIINHHDGFAIEFHSSPFSTISNNTIINGNMGIHIAGSRYTLISNNTIIKNYKQGIMLVDDNAHHITIINNNISNNKRGGIWIFASNDHIISNNLILNNKGDGIHIYGSGNTISNNIISNNSGGILIAYDKNKILYNTIFDNSPYGILVDNRDSNIIKGNKIYNNKHGIILNSGSRYNKINDNIFTNEGLFLDYCPENTIDNNTVNDKRLICLYKESDKIIFTNAGQVILINCNNITIKNLDLSNATAGIQLLNSNNCLIEENILTNNKKYGIFIKGNSNAIIKNNIEKNKNGLYWDGKYNLVKRNNFINNDLDAYFKIAHKGGLTTRWIKNYWDRPRIVPRLIFGLKEYIIDILYYPIYIPFPWIAFDWFPAILPN